MLFLFLISADKNLAGVSSGIVRTEPCDGITN